MNGGVLAGLCLDVITFAKANPSIDVDRVAFGDVEPPAEPAA